VRRHQTAAQALRAAQLANDPEATQAAQAAYNAVQQEAQSFYDLKNKYNGVVNEIRTYSFGAAQPPASPR
jgi:hypothetical protein